MKKFKILGFIVLILIIVVLSYSIYVLAKENPQENQENKILSEISYVEAEFTDLFNTMNNIETRNYGIEIDELSKETAEKMKESESSSSEGGQSSSSGSGSSGTEESSSNTSSGENGETNQDSEKYDLKLNGVLTTTKDINWDIVKSEVENLYTSIPTMTMDLYQLNINKDEILNFNKEIDNLVTVVNEENKESTLQTLSVIYDYLPKFLESAKGEDVIYKKVVETKANIFKGYSKLDSGKWDEISQDIQNGVNTFTELLSNPDVINSNNQYSVNKIYIMLNELQNAVNMQDVSVFLIKYKNLIEEIEAI